MEETKSYRIRTTVNGDAPSVVNVNLNQTYDMFEILSLKLGQDKVYKLYQSDYGIVVGRVLANKGFGIPNAKVSIFIPNESEDQSSLDWSLYPFMSINSWAPGGTRYNLLPDEQQSECHQNVGTFPNKKLLLDNNDVIEVFDKYWKYTTVTNNAGDYMLYGIPTGTQQLHVDIDLSDIGVLSQSPRDMIYKGYDINTFDSPNKFKKSTTLESLPQIKSQDMGVYVYPFWGDTTDNGPIAITRCDINIDYTFEPTCVFMGSVITDSGSNAIGKNCRATKRNGRMDELVSGEGTIEMIRKTFTGKVEEVKIQGGRVIDSDGVWCYQIPMNLDYVVTDEFGNLVPSDNPEIGIPTRTRVRFRVTLDDAINDATGRKRAKYLIPNNPRVNDDNPVFSETLEPDYEFGTQTKDESFRDLFWNNVYTVKNYIPRLQKNKKTSDKWHTGIKWINHYGDNNPMPYNSLRINLTFTYRFICILAKVFVNLIQFLNIIIVAIFTLFCELCDKFRSIGNKTKWIGVGFLFLAVSALFCKITASCVKVPKEFCEDGNVKYTFYPGCSGCVFKKTKTEHYKDEKGCENDDSCTEPITAKEPLYNCLENQLAQDNDVTSFNFINDWINGTLYMPLWFRKITPKRKYLFGLIRIKAKDRWCSAEKEASGFRIYQPCSLKRTGKNTVTLYNGKNATAYTRIPSSECKDNRCHDKEYKDIKVNKGVIQPKQTILDETVYYYRPVEFDNTLNTNNYRAKEKINDVYGEIKLLFATDIVLLGSLNECDLHCAPQFFKNLESSTYNMPEDLLLTDSIATPTIKTKNGKVNSNDDDDYEIVYDFQSKTEMTGADWGNNNPTDQCGKAKDGDGGVFYSIGCSTIEFKRKSCINLERACEFGVTTDETAPVDVSVEENNEPVNVAGTLIPDGFISYDELYNVDARGMFATLNGNNLKTKRNNKGFLEYDFRYLYPNNFDGSMYDIMRERQRRCDKSYAKNYALELYSEDYYHFRLGDEPYFYTSPTEPDSRLARYENSFYFYFGLKKGSTAIEKFNSQFFSDCTDVVGGETQVNIIATGNTTCKDNTDEPDGYITIDVTGIDTPYTVIMKDEDDNEYRIGRVENGQIVYDINDEKIIIYANKNKTDGYTAFDVQDVALHIRNGNYDIIIEDSNTNITESTVQMGELEIPMILDTIAFGLSNDDASLDKCNMTAWTDEIGGISGDREGPTGLGGIVIVDGLCAAMNGIPSQNEETGSVSVEQKFNITLSSDELKCNDANDNVYYPTADISVTITKTIVNNVAQYTASLENNTAVDVARLAKEEVVGEELVTTVVDGDITQGVANIKVYIAAWYGDVSYTVNVVEMCGDEMSSRTGVGNIVVAQPIPFKMYINGVDYDIISHWKSGYNYLNKTFSSSGEPLSGWIDIATSGLETTSEVRLSDWEHANENTRRVYDRLKANGWNGSPYNWNANPDAYIFKMPEEVMMLYEAPNTGKIEIVSNHKEKFTSVITVIPNGCSHSCLMTSEQFNAYDEFCAMIRNERERNTAFGSDAYFLYDSTEPDTVIFNGDEVTICFNNVEALQIELSSTYAPGQSFMTEEQFGNVDISDINMEAIANIRDEAKAKFRTCSDEDKRVETDTYRDEQRENGEIYGLKPKVYYCEPPADSPTGEDLSTLILQYFGSDNDALDSIEEFLSAYGIVSYMTEPTNTSTFCDNIIYSNSEIDLRYDVVDDMNEIYNNRLDLVTLAKEAFWKMCENDDKSIVLSYQTNSVPVKYRIDYKAEVEDEETGEREVEPRVTSNTTTNYVNDIVIPSLSVLNFPYNSMHKPPYAVAIENARKQRLPVDFDYTINTNNVSGMFLTHIVDKPLTVDYFMWAAKKIDLSTNGHDIFYGYMHGNIQNGVLKPIDGDMKFTTQLIGDNEISFTTINGENSLPTIRTMRTFYTSETIPIYHNPTPEENWINTWFNCEPNPNEGDDNDYTKWPMPYEEMELTISDDYCTVSETLYGKMAIVIEGSTAMGSEGYGGYGNFLKVTATNCEEENTEFFIIWAYYYKNEYVQDDPRNDTYSYYPYEPNGGYGWKTGINYINTDDTVFYNSLPEIYTKNYSYFPGASAIDTSVSQLYYHTVYGINYNREDDTYSVDYGHLTNSSNCGLFTGGFDPNDWGGQFYVVAICNKRVAVVSDLLDFSGTYMIRAYMKLPGGNITQKKKTGDVYEALDDGVLSNYARGSSSDENFKSIINNLFGIQVIWGTQSEYYEKNEKINLLFKRGTNKEYPLPQFIIDKSTNMSDIEYENYQLPLNGEVGVWEHVTLIDIDAYLETVIGNDYISGKRNYVMGHNDEVANYICNIFRGIEHNKGDKTYPSVYAVKGGTQFLTTLDK